MEVNGIPEQRHIFKYLISQFPGALSCIRGSAAGLALSMSIGGLQLGLSTASRRLEEELRQRQADVSTLSTGNRVPVSTVPGAKG